jgi:hypothetical protein
MADMNEDELRDLERRSRAAFDASVEATDAATRSRLAAARRVALAGLDRGRLVRAAAWVPAGAVAAVVVAALIWKRDDARGPALRESAIAFEDLDIVTGGEDFDLLGEDADFVAWAAGENPDDVG